MESMKLTKEESKEQDTVEGSKPEYPWGLRIHLDKETLEKLGIEKMPSVGSQMPLKGLVTVTDVSVSERQDGGTERNMTLQITEMELGSTKTEKDPSEELYGTPKDPTKEGSAVYVEGI